MKFSVRSSLNIPKIIEYIENHLSHREKKIAGVCLGLVIFSIFYFLGIKPVISKWVALDNSIRLRKTTLIKLQKLTSQLYKYPEVGLSKTDDGEIETFEILKQLEGFSNQSGLRIKNIKPLDTKVEPIYTKEAIQLEAEGEMIDLVRFLCQVETLPQTLNIERMQISPWGKSASGLNIHLIIYSIQIKSGDVF